MKEFKGMKEFDEMIKKYDELDFEEQIMLTEKLDGLVKVFKAFTLLKLINPNITLAEMMQKAMGDCPFGDGDKSPNDESPNEEEKPKSFKKGAKVKIKSLEDDFPSGAEVGDICEIIEADKHGVALRWNRDVGGWGFDGNCWWVTTDCLELI